MLTTRKQMQISAGNPFCYVWIPNLECFGEVIYDVPESGDLGVYLDVEDCATPLAELPKDWLVRLGQAH